MLARACLCGDRAGARGCHFFWHSSDGAARVVGYSRGKRSGESDRLATIDKS